MKTPASFRTKHRAARPGAGVSFTRPNLITRSNIMKTSRFHPDLLTVLRTAALALLALLLCVITAWSQALNSTTTFQGTLHLEGAPANGTFDILYRVVANASADGAEDGVSGPTRTNRAVRVSQGVFTTDIEIPLEAIDWPQRFLDLQIRPSGEEAFQSLAPRLPITPVPAALVADTARAVSAGAVTAAALGSNVITAASLADGAVTAAKVGEGQLIKSINGLTDDVVLEAGEGLTLTTVGKKIILTPWFTCVPWCLDGNLGTQPAPAQTVTATFLQHHFVGTRDNKPLELRVNNRRALRIEHTGGNFAPNLLGGYGMNVAVPGTRGATIGGGGAVNAANQITETTGFGKPHFTTISGGLLNRITSSTNATVSGGRANVIERDSHGSTVGGGSENLIDANSPGSIIAAGVLNHIGVSSDGSTISGGYSNHMEWFNDYTTIGGGSFNEIRWMSSHSSIGGGFQNIVAGDIFAGTIGGGHANYLMSENSGVTIAGGGANFIGKSAHYGTIGGGAGNQIQPFAEGSTIAGGVGNNINGGPSSQPSAIGGGQGNQIGNSAYSTVAGGYLNTIVGGAPSAGGVIGGGQVNTLQYGAAFSTISGGLANSIEDFSERSSIGGGSDNVIHQDSPESVIAGGGRNIIMSNSGASVVGGGRLNYVGPNSFSSTISGGESNLVESASTWSTIGGGFSNRIGELNVSSTVGGGSTNSITYDSKLITIAGGGGNRVGIETTGATVGGGYMNDIGGRSHHATIGGGNGNNIVSIAPNATIAGGTGNTIVGGAFSREASAIGGGKGNYITASGEYATIPGGLEASARRHGQLSHASGSFANAGDAQTSTHVLRGTSTGTALQDLFLDGSSKLLTIPADSTYTFEIHVAGRSQNGNSAGYKICGVIKNVGGTVSFVGTPVMPVVMEDVASWNVTAIADTANTSLSIQAIGSANTPVRWVATVRTTEVVFP